MADISDVPPMVNEGDTVEVRMDDLMCTTDGVNPIVDDAMKAYIEDILAEDAKKLELGLADDVTANHVAEEIQLTEEDVAKIEAEQRKSEEAVAAEDDGFQTVGKKGKAKKPTPVSSSSTTASSLPPRGPVGEVHRAPAPEVRPPMKGDSKFPFCFTCSLRHDFGACGAEPFPDSDDE